LVPIRKVPPGSSIMPLESLAVAMSVMSACGEARFPEPRLAAQHGDPGFASELIGDQS